MDLKASGNRNQPESSSDFVVKVTFGPDGLWQGQVEHVQSGRSYYFNSYLAMVLFIQEKLEESGLPRADARLRSWSDKTGSFKGEA